MSFFRDPFFLFLLFVLNVNSIRAEFISLHQEPLTHNVSSETDLNGVLQVRTTSPLVGFKNQYNPTGVSGCIIGYSELRNLCQTPSGGLSFSIKNGYVDLNEFKVYVPAGTRFFSLTGNFPQNTEYAVTVKFKTPPLRVNALSSSEYASVKSAQQVDTDFNKILNGQEVMFVHSGGGNMALSGTWRLNRNPLATGDWLYLRVINKGHPIYLPGAIYEVDHELYKQAFNNISFASDGDPMSSSSGSGTTPTTPTMPITPITPTTPVAPTTPTTPAPDSSNAYTLTDLHFPSPGRVTVLNEAQAQEYLDLNQDVKKAFENKTNEDQRSLVQFATEHYNKFFSVDGRPRSVKEYLDCNPDIEYGFYDSTVNTNTDDAKTNLKSFVSKHFSTFIQKIVPVSSRNFNTYGCVDLREYLSCHSDVKTICSNKSQGDRDYFHKMLICAKEHYKTIGKNEGRDSLRNCK